jgi:hypothetical protein
MISHRSIMTKLAEAIQASQDVANYCFQHFGQALAINVGAYANGIPNENDSPFLWIHAADDENEQVGSEDSFTVRIVVGGCVKGPDGERYIENVVVPRSASVNGLVINGGNVIVEDLRDMIIGIVREAKAGAYPLRIRREENDISHAPLEWAVIYVEYNEPEALN